MMLIWRNSVCICLKPFPLQIFARIVLALFWLWIWLRHLREPRRTCQIESNGDSLSCNREDTSIKACQKWFRVFLVSSAFLFANLMLKAFRKQRKYTAFHNPNGLGRTKQALDHFVRHAFVWISWPLEQSKTHCNSRSSSRGKQISPVAPLMPAAEFYELNLKQDLRGTPLYPISRRFLKRCVWWSKSEWKTAKQKSKATNAVPTSPRRLACSWETEQRLVCHVRLPGTVTCMTLLACPLWARFESWKERKLVSLSHLKVLSKEAVDI